jgi:outer membrane immunogenic protein
MKKITFVLFLTLAGLTTSFAQGSLANGAKQVNAGIGFSNYGVPVYLGVDFGVHESITVGPKFSYRRFNDNYFNSDFTQSLIVISFNGNYHFNKLIELPREWDLYAGVTLGYYIWSSSKINGIEVGQSSGVGFDAQIGARYFFSDKFGVNLEFGGGTGTGGSFGITIKL